MRRQAIRVGARFKLRANPLAVRRALVLQAGTAFAGQLQTTEEFDHGSD